MDDVMCGQGVGEGGSSVTAARAPKVVERPAIVDSARGHQADDQSNRGSIQLCGSRQAAHAGWGRWGYGLLLHGRPVCGTGTLVWRCAALSGVVCEVCSSCMCLALLLSLRPSFFFAFRSIGAEPATLPGNPKGNETISP